MIRQLYIPKESLSLKKETIQRDTTRYTELSLYLKKERRNKCATTRYNDKKLFFEEGEVINCETRRYTEIKHVSEEEVTLNMIRHGILK